MHAFSRERRLVFFLVGADHGDIDVGDLIDIRLFVRFSVAVVRFFSEGPLRDQSGALFDLQIGVIVDPRLTGGNRQTTYLENFTTAVRQEAILNEKTNKIRHLDMIGYRRISPN